NRVEEFDFESANRKQLRGNIYLAKVTRVEPSLQAAFVDYGGNRHGFLAFSEIHPDYYQIPVADRPAPIAEEERAHRDAQAEAERDGGAGGGTGRHHHPGRRGGAERQSDETGRSEPVETGAAETEHGEPHEAAAAEQATEAAGGDIVAETPVEPRASPEAPASEPEHPLAEPAAQSSPDTMQVESPPAAAEAVEPEMVAAEAATTAPEDHASEDHPSEEHATEEHREGGNGEAGTVEEVAETGGDGEEDEVVESVGGADVMEEVPDRAPRLRRQYKIQEVIKRRQIMLVQVVKEERGTKGAALTTYLSLA